MSHGDSQSAEPRARRRGGHSDNNNNNNNHQQSASQQNKSRRQAQASNTGSYGGASRDQHQRSTRQHQQSQENSNEDKPALASSKSRDDTEHKGLPQQQTRLAAVVSPGSLVKYSADELLALRDSSLIQPPASFSPYTPLRPGSQVKLPEIASQASADPRVAIGGSFFGLENYARASKDAPLSQRHPNVGHRGQGGMSQRMLNAMGAGAGAPEGAYSHGSRAAGSQSSYGNGRGMQGRAGNGSNAGQSGARHNRSGSGNANANASSNASANGGNGSWRSAGAMRAVASAAGTLSVVGRAMGDAAAAAAAAAGAAPMDGGQPEWMADEMSFDEGQSVQRMHDIEEWKRRMREGGGGHGSLGGMAHEPASDPAELGAAAMRGSRFLRMFSDSNSDQASTRAAPAASALSGAAAGGGADFGSSTIVNASVGVNAYASANDMGHFGEALGTQDGDQLSKLFKVFGDKVSLGGGPSGGMMANPMQTAATTQAVPSAPTVQQQQSQQPASISSAAISLLAPAPQNGALHARPAPLSGLRNKSASPAHINEALRGIVPTSVFRKSVQSSQGSGQGGAKRNSDASGTPRAGTPARNLPSWLVELSRGSASPSASPLASGGAPVITNESLGAQDLVDTLERGFPPLGSRAMRHADNQSVSSLSVQASVGAPSEANGGFAQRQDSEEGSPRLQVQSQTQSQAQTQAQTQAQIQAQVQAQSQAQSQSMHQQMQAHQMQIHGLPGMMLPPPPHMMVPEGAMVPGLVHPSQMTVGMMPPPPPHAMGFHPGMMFGMMPPPPPPGMYGNMPPVSLAQMGIPAGDPAQEQALLKLAMMQAGEMPPPPPPPSGLMFGQAGSMAQPQQMYPAGLPFAGLAGHVLPESSGALSSEPMLQHSHPMPPNVSGAASGGNAGAF
ncbi:hypothetical protein GGI07_003416 [Coemansia sp. Benny D115]|nr:hypothetical protein GGI07_003416 [Coemansia sp. Benny D115]